MRRKTRNTRSSTKGKTETGSPSPRKSTRSSTRREEEEDSSAKNEVEIEPDKVEIERETVCDNNITDSEKVENNSDLVGETQEVQKSEIVEDIEVKEKDEENDKGKSTGINKTNTDQTSNTIEPEIVNEHVQGSTPSPIDTDDIVQNSNDTEIIKSKVEDQNEELNEKSKDTEPKTSEIQDSSESQTDNFQSEYANENLKDLTNFEKNNHDDKVATLDSKTNNNEEQLDSNTNHKEEQLDSNTNTEEQPEKKKITLKRPPLEETKRSSSPLEDGEIQEPKEKTKKIILKRRTISDDNSDFNNKIVINRRSSAGEENPEKRKRQISVTEEITPEKPKKPSKVVKLIRNISHDSQDTEDNHKPLRRQNSWGKTEFLDNLSANIYTVDVDSIKSVCTTVEFLNETEVKLEDAPKEHPKIESDVIKKKVEEEKTDDDTEKEETEEEESSEEQKIEANPNIIALNRKISIVEDTAAKMRPPPSPAKNPPSEILYITNLVRPFTVKQLKELLERTGKIREDCFWTDRIKSKCYARYESIEEAEATRNALHGVFWPIGNGKQLVIDFATEEDMEKAKNPVPSPTIVPEQPIQKENQEPDLSDARHRERDRDPEREDRRRTTSGRDWDKSREEHRRKHSRSRSKSRDRVRKHSRRSYTPEDHNRKKQKFGDESVPQKLMDDLFLKTKTTPSIYWQPLSPHEIATKQQQRLVRMEKHKRKIEETRGRRDRDVRGSFRRR